jgi:signal transduction histidine kinase
MDINLVFRYAAIRFLLCLCFAGPIAMLVFLTQSIYFACVMILFSAFVWPIVDRFTKVFTDTVDRLPPFRGRYDHLTKVTDHIQRLNGATEIKEWAQILADSIKSLLKIRRVNILVWNSEKKYFMNRGGVGLTPADTVFLSLPPDSSISLNLSRNRKMLIRDLVSIEYQPKEAEKLLNEFDFLSSDISVPLFVGNDLRAFINICLDVKGQLLNDLEIGSLLHIATGASISLHSILATQSYEESKLEWAHDLRHPFGPKGGLQHINELLTFASNNLPNNLLKKLESIRDDIWYVGKHLEKILQSGGGEETLNIQTTSLIGTFERIRDDYQLYAKEKKIEWVVDIPDKQVSVRCDEESIKYRVLPNFLNNAFRITPNGGRIELGYRLNQESFVGFIKDNGPGMKKNIMISIFERGVQGDNSTRGSKGIGLYNVRKVIEAQGGKVWVESEPGKGSCFYFSLPIEKHGARSSAI